MKIPQFAVLLPCVAGLEDESTLLSMHRASVTLDAEMASTNLLTAATSRNVTQMASLMQSLVEESIKGDGIAALDDDIRAAMKTIQDTLLAGIRTTLLNEHDVDQKAIMDQLKCFDGCKEDRTLKEQKCNGHGREFEYLWEQHSTCRSQLYTQYISHIQKCSSLDVWVESFKLEEKPLEECVYDRQYECRNRVCEEGECQPEIDAEFGKWLNRIIKAAEAGYEQWTTLHGECKAEYHAYIALDSKCDQFEKQQETTNGRWRQCEHEACTVDYTKCRADCIAEYHETVKRVECAEKDRKIDWSASEKIECYIRIMLNSPTAEELDKHCKDKTNCLNEWRTHEYNKCNVVCEHVDYNTGSYSLHDHREAQHGERLHIDATSTEGKDGLKNPKQWHKSTHADIQHADSTKYTSDDANPDKVNTTHRDGGDEAGRCTWHLDIDFQPIPCAIPCPPPRPCCDEEYKQKYESQFMSAKFVAEVATVPVCPRGSTGFGEHQEKYAYNLCECCVSHCTLMGKTSIEEDDYCPCTCGQRPKVSVTKTFENFCVRTKGDEPATFDMGDHTCADRVTITHRSGSVGSAGDGSQDRFGNRGGNNLNIVIAKDKTAVLPKQENTMGFTSQGAGYWYTLDNANPNSQSIVFQLKDGVYDFKMEGSFNLYYGEDMLDYTEDDNLGMACYDIEVVGEYC